MKKKKKKKITKLTKADLIDNANDNELPRINEGFDYLDNHPNEKVALAMEVVIQIGNAWDDGIRELTPSMKKHLLESIAILNRVTDKNSQINGLIRNGDYYLKHMNVLEHHNYEDIIMPAF